ncbi:MULTISPECIES: hypothetical protein [Legionella]|uniref:Uncharacterized protein n=1 Tax=Legionella drozanskii LLAP-1 TaxID=1212489 RepID=A0A0W0SWJ4_9GAMM|nr:MULTISPECIES: hypothetical protein [Legionella]KTC87628.1 hypothetical protein Ldro_1247 [Legionella drozanskii LLAP-1]
MRHLILGAVLFFCSYSAIAQCELRLNNLTDKPALAWIQYDQRLDDQVNIAPHRSLFVDLHYGGYCHDKAYFKLYRYAHELYFSGVLASGQVFDIHP